MKTGWSSLWVSSLFLFVLLPLSAQTPPSKGDRLASAAQEQVGVTVIYDPAYVKLAYPGGDVPMERGVCTDVVIRAFRKQGLDLQKSVHEDMSRNFSLYPKNWGLSSPDPNIDHRRVPNLRVYFTRQGWAVPVTKNADDYKTGDIVTWQLASGVPHIGIVAADRTEDSSRPLMIHNIGLGAQKEDFLFGATITAHFRPK